MNGTQARVLSKARYRRLQQHGQQVVALWRVMGAARRDNRERCCDSAANTSAIAARVLKGRVGQEMIIIAVLVTIETVVLPQRHHHLLLSSV